jgi:hypothetical protein
MTKLRERIQEDLRIRDYAPSTVVCYCPVGRRHSGGMRFFHRNTSLGQVQLLQRGTELSDAPVLHQPEHFHHGPIASAETVLRSSASVAAPAARSNRGFVTDARTAPDLDLFARHPTTIGGPKPAVAVTAPVLPLGGKEKHQPFQPPGFSKCEVI